MPPGFALELLSRSHFTGAPARSNVLHPRPRTRVYTAYSSTSFILGLRTLIRTSRSTYVPGRPDCTLLLPMTSCNRQVGWRVAHCQAFEYKSLLPHFTCQIARAAPLSRLVRCFPDFKKHFLISRRPRPKRENCLVLMSYPIFMRWPVAPGTYGGRETSSGLSTCSPMQL